MNRIPETYMSALRTGLLPLLVTIILSVQSAYLDPAFAQTSGQNDIVFSFSRDEISDTGIDRFAEILGRLGLFQTLSLDRYSTRASLFSLSLEGDLGPMVILDGQPQYYDLFGREQYHLIPLSPTDIDSISIRTAPSMDTDRFGTGGDILVNTIRPNGLSLRGVFGFANEINDPGPFRFTSRQTPNVDRDGPRTDLRLSYGNRPWFVQMAWRGDVHHVTDPRLNGRIWTRYEGLDRARLTLTAPELFIAYEKNDSRHSFRAGGNTFKDFFYLESLGGETPLVQTWKYLSAAGTFGTGENTHIRYRFDRRQLSIRERPVQIPFGARWSEIRTNGMLEVTQASDRFNTSASIGFDERLTRNYSPAPRTRTVRIALGADARLSRQLMQSVSVRLGTPGHRIQGQRRFTVAASTSLSWERRGTFTLTYMEHPQEDYGSLVGQLRNGRILPFRSERNITLPPYRYLRRTFHAGVVIHLVSGRLFSWRPFVFFRRFSGLEIADYDRTFETSNRRFNSLTEYIPNVEGNLFSAGSRIQFRPSDLIRADLVYFYTHTLSISDETFNRSLSSNNGNQAQLTVFVRPNNRFRLYSRISWSSDRNWFDYRVVDFAARPDFVSADVTVQKDFWYDHLQISFSALSIGNAAFVRHPAAGSEQMVFRISIRGRL